MPIITLLFALFAVVGLDQFTKIWASETLATRSVEIIPSVFSLDLAHNTGIAFSFPLEGILLSAVTIALILMIIVYYWKNERAAKSMWIHVGYGLLLGGALSNGFDRIVYGFVVDFLSLRHFAIFNVADIAISVGVFLLLILSYYARSKSTR